MSKNNVTYYSTSPLEFFGGFEKDLIEKANLLSKNPGTKVTIATLDKNMIKKLHLLLSIYQLRRSKTEYRLSELEVMNLLDSNVHYKKHRSLTELKKELRNADVVYTKNELVEILALAVLKIPKHTRIIVGIVTAIQYPPTKSISIKSRNLLYRSW